MPDRQVLEDWLKQRPLKRYAEMLDEALDRSGHKLVWIAEQCTKGGAPIKDTTLSKLRKGNQLPPTEPDPDSKEKSTNRVLAQLLGIDEEAFVLAAALEHTPVPILEFAGLELRATVAGLALALQECGREKEYEQAVAAAYMLDRFTNIYNKRAKKRAPLAREVVPMAGHDLIKSMIKSLAREVGVPASAITAAVSAAHYVHTHEKRGQDL